MSETGRVQQKARTRAALVAAARQLMASGVAPTVEQAAAAAEISRATAYRYFANQQALLIATYPEIDGTSLLGAEPPTDPATRLELVAEAIARQAVDHETELRAMLRLSLEPEDARRPDLPFRVGRRIVWVADALTPLQGRLSEPDLQRLVLAIASAVGIDSLVWLTDIAGLSRPQAVDVMRWSARSLLQAALARHADAPAAAG
ncbi:MAG TPA: TetR/AcrR family transcriptional regulator [Gaiellales bacterium]|jgi:AcrR family transcriptional regulator|nr:TetR/AcrR family transcriptional regulator [Gaiellales bacterium]